MTRDNFQSETHAYVTTVLRLYLQLPDTPMHVNANDRRTAAELQARGVKLSVVESALVLASVRRLQRAPDRPPLAPIRSLAYFLPVIQEILDNPMDEDYLRYLRGKLHSLNNTDGIEPRCR